MTDKAKHTKPKGDKPDQKPAGLALGYQTLSVDLIDDPEQPIRTDLTPASVEELVLSIRQVGLIEPVVVKPVKGRYEIIAGHRRLFACRVGNIPLIPCFVREANSEQTEMLKIHENLYRESISPTDEAQHFDYLIQKQGMTPTRISKLISKSTSYVSDRLAIINYPPFLKSAMDKGEITFSVAREFARFDDEKQMVNAVYYAKRSGMTSNLARRWVKDAAREKDSKYGKGETSSDGAEGAQAVEHTATCVYCNHGVKLIEAEVVYMHRQCLNQATSEQSKAEAEAEPLTS